MFDSPTCDGRERYPARDGRDDDESAAVRPSGTERADPPQRDRLVISIPFELMSREAAHREMDALFAEQARRAKE